MKKKQIVCTYNNETSKDYKQYTILSVIILLPIILKKWMIPASLLPLSDDNWHSIQAAHNLLLIVDRQL